MINKHKIYLEVAQSISKLSKDQSTKVGCCIVDSDGKVLSLGYNGFVSKADDSEIDYTGKEFHAYLDKTDQDFITNKNRLMIHSEINAILTASDKNKIVGSTVYITHYPCNQCALILAQSKIKDIYVLDNKTKSFDSYIKETLYILECANINMNIIHTLD